MKLWQRLDVSCDTFLLFSTLKPVRLWRGKVLRALVVCAEELDEAVLG